MKCREAKKLAKRHGFVPLSVNGKIFALIDKGGNIEYTGLGKRSLKTIINYMRNTKKIDRS